MPPVVVVALLGALAVQLRQLLARERLDAAFFRKPCEELFVLLAGVAPHDGSKRRVGFQRRRVHADRIDKLSLARQAIPRSESIPSK